jgi:hypothetical protein
MARWCPFTSIALLPNVRVQGSHSSVRRPSKRRRVPDREPAVRGPTAGRPTLAVWSSIPRRLRKAVSGLSVRELAARGGSEGRSIREYVHHLVEANLVTSTIVLAALGRPGCKFDWSWLIPDTVWMRRLRYDRLPVDPAIDLLESLCLHVAGVVRQAPGSMRRKVRLVGSQSRRASHRTLGQVLEDECEHARHHLRDIESTKGAVSGTTRKGRPS